MLVLTRTVGEDGILIGDDVRVVLLKRRGNAIQIGIEAPKEIPVLREELDPLESDDREDRQG